MVEVTVVELSKVELSRKRVCGFQNSRLPRQFVRHVTAENGHLSQSLEPNRTSIDASYLFVLPGANALSLFCLRDGYLLSATSESDDHDIRLNVPCFFVPLSSYHNKSSSGPGHFTKCLHEKKSHYLRYDRNRENH